MNSKQQAFVEEYLIDLNATQAAIRAGYSAKTANRIAQQLLSKLDIQEAVKAAQGERSERTQITADYVLNGLREVAERSLQRKPVFDMRGKQVKNEEGKDVWRFDSQGANRAFELLGKHLGMFTDKVQMDLNVTPAAILEEVRKRRERTG